MVSDHSPIYSQADMDEVIAERDALAERVRRYETLVRVMERDMISQNARWSYEAIDARAAIAERDDDDL